MEQGHGSAATIHKFHPQLGSKWLARRAFLHQCRCLFQTSAEERRLAQLQAKLNRLLKKQPQRITGRQVFLRDLFHQLQEVPGAPSGSGQAHSLMRRHGPYYQALPDSAKLDYQRAATALRLEREALIQGEADTVRAQMQLLVRRTQEWREAGERCQLSACKLSDSTLLLLLEKFNVFITSPAFTALKKVEENVVSLPSFDTLQLLNDQSPASWVPEMQGTTPTWARVICKQRARFHRAIVLLPDMPVSRPYLIAVAMQNPLNLLLVPLSWVPVALGPATDALGDTWRAFVQRRSLWQFHYRYTSTVNASALGDFPLQEVVMVQDVLLQGHGQLVSDFPSDTLAALAGSEAQSSESRPQEHPSAGQASREHHRHAAPASLACKLPPLQCCILQASSPDLATDCHPDSQSGASRPRCGG